MQFLIGADPEVLITNKYGHYKSAVGMVGGTKQNPKPIDNLGHAIQEDNVSVEFNIPPANSLTSFRASIHKVLDHIRSILPDYLIDKASAVSFPPEELDTMEAQTFGCEPDYNAWTKHVNPKPQTADENLRSAGGHIHVGSDVAINNSIAVIRAMDLFLGVPSIALDNGTLRRKLYGSAGSFRKKSYGAEYRTLSNFWIFDDSLISWAYQGTQRALEFVDKGNEIPNDIGFLIQRCINTSNKDDMNHLNNIYKIM
jgi:hypothetical protein